MLNRIILFHNVETNVNELMYMQFFKNKMMKITIINAVLQTLD